MRIGFCTGYSVERIKFAKEAGFDVLEISVGAGAPLDPTTISDDQIEKAADTLAGNGIAAMTVFHFEDYADPDPVKRERAAKNFVRSIDICKAFGTNVLTLNAWVPRDADVDGKLAFYKKTFGKFAEIAEDKGILVGIENCPHGLANIAYSPAMWERMFDVVPSKAIGLEYDPSHLLWQGADYLRALVEFGDRVYAFHAKDTEILTHIQAWEGAYSNWWRFRIPGWGNVDWKKIFTILYDINYKGDITIEHEDPVFSGSRTDQGLRMGLRFLREFVV